MRVSEGGPAIHANHESNSSLVVEDLGLRGWRQDLYADSFFQNFLWDDELDPDEGDLVLREMLDFFARGRWRLIH